MQLGIKILGFYTVSNSKDSGILASFLFLKFQDCVSQMPGLKNLWLCAEFIWFYLLNHEINNSIELFISQETILCNSEWNEKLFRIIIIGENLSICLNQQFNKF